MGTLYGVGGWDPEAPDENVVAALPVPDDDRTAEQVLALGAQLVQRAGDLLAALDQIPLDEPARPAIEIVTEAATTAAEGP